MQLVIRKQPILKSTAYALLCLCLLLFSASFFPALRLTRGAPILLVAAISLLARFEGIYYASFFAVMRSLKNTADISITHMGEV